MHDWTPREYDFMDYLDKETNIGGYGLLMAKVDPIAFNVGCSEWESTGNYEIT